MGKVQTALFVLVTLNAKQPVFAQFWHYYLLIPLYKVQYSLNCHPIFHKNLLNFKTIPFQTQDAPRSKKLFRDQG